MNKDLERVDCYIEIQDAMMSGKGTVIGNIDRLIKNKIKANNAGWILISLFSFIIYICISIIWSNAYEELIYQKKAEKEAYIVKMKAWCDSVANDRNSVAADAKYTIDFIRAEKGKP